jgi:membrane protease YdiL (CAAX protease family)
MRYTGAMEAAKRVPVSTASTASGGSSPWLLVGLFIVLSCGGAWLVALPLWLGGEGLASPMAGALLPLMMYTPALAVTVVLALRRTRPSTAVRELGLWPLRPVGRVIGMTAAGILGSAIVVGAGVAIAAALGFVRLDLVHFSGYTALIRAAAGDAVDDVPVGALVAAQLVAIPFGALFNGLLAFGEEVGWRGWLLPALRPLGTWPALAVSGAIWGLWHSPLLLLGYDFDQPNVLGVLLMVVACTIIGTLFGWLRLRSGSLWPAVFAHGALNACGGLVVLFAAEGQQPDLVLAGPVGVGTWIAGAVVIGLLVAARQFAPRRLRGAQATSRPSGA